MPRKPRKLRISEDFCDTDLLEKPILRILRRHKVPKEWLEPPVVYILTVVAQSGFPEAQFLDTPSNRTRSFLEKSTPKQRQAWSDRWKKRGELVRIYRAQERALLGLLAKLSTEDPLKFFRVLAAISKYIHQRLQSPQFKAARHLWHWGAFRPEILDKKRSELAKDLTKTVRLKISTKVVEHALKTVRAAGL